MTDPYRAHSAQSAELLQVASSTSAPALAMASALADLATVSWWHGQRGKTLAIDTLFTDPARMGHMLTVLLQEIQPPLEVVQAAIRIKLAWYRQQASQEVVTPTTLQGWCAVIRAFATRVHDASRGEP